MSGDVFKVKEFTHSGDEMTTDLVGKLVGKKMHIPRNPIPIKKTKFVPDTRDKSKTIQGKRRLHNRTYRRDYHRYCDERARYSDIHERFSGQFQSNVMAFATFSDTNARRGDPSVVMEICDIYYESVPSVFPRFPMNSEKVKLLYKTDLECIEDHWCIAYRMTDSNKEHCDHSHCPIVYVDYGKRHGNAIRSLHHTIKELLKVIEKQNEKRGYCEVGGFLTEMTNTDETEKKIYELKKIKDPIHDILRPWYSNSRGEPPVLSWREWFYRTDSRPMQPVMQMDFLHRI